MASLGLCILASTQKQADKVSSKYGKYFDQIYVQLAPNCQDFATARNKLLNQVRTDYWAWMDTDDEIDNPEGLKKLVETWDGQFDAVMMPYEYQRSKDGELQAYQWRERVLRIAYPWRWKGAIHETPVHQGDAQIVLNEEITFKHKSKTEKEIKTSAQRNHRILVKEANKKVADPRMLYYLGGSYYFFKEYDKAIKTLTRYIAEGGWEEEKYRAWLHIIKSYLQMGKYEEAVSAGMAALKLFPQYPYAYIDIARAYHEKGELDKALSWLEQGLSKELPKEMGMQDPSEYVRATVMGAVDYDVLGESEQAYNMLTRGLELSPNNKALLSLKSHISYKYFEHLTLNNMRKLVGYGVS